MSGIAGILHMDASPVSTIEVEGQLKTLAHRGLDGSGIWCQGEIGLIHQKLNSTPESVLSYQPFLNTDLNLVITADARIDNRDDLLSVLNLPAPLTSKNITDEAIILAAYNRWGEKCVEYLLGDFSFAIWDIDEKELLCGRDIFGVKPFYYYYDKKLFIFGSEIKAIFDIKDLPKLINEEKIAEFMLEMFENKERTFYRYIFRLPPAHSLKVTRDGMFLRRYWAPDPDKELHLHTETEYGQVYREIFVNAVRSRLRSAHPIGTLLSGGLDSTSITCVAENLLISNNLSTLDTYSIIFKSVSKSDEYPYIKAALEEGNYNAHYIEGDQLNPVSDLLNNLRHQEEPIYAPQLYLNRGVWNCVSQYGGRVILDGLMGDNVTSHGYPYLNQLAREWNLFYLYSQVRELVRHHQDPAPIWKIIGTYIWRDSIKSHVPAFARQAWNIFNAKNKSAQMNGLNQIFNPEYIKKIHLDERIHEKTKSASEKRTAHQQHFYDLENGLIPTALESYNHEISPYRIETRFPFLDRSLVEFCLAIPSDQKIRHGYTRWVVREGLKNYLPEKIRLRSGKGDLSWNFLRGLQTDHELLQNILEMSVTAGEAYLNMKTLKNICQRIPSGGVTEDETLTVYLGAQIISWLTYCNY